MAGGPHLLVGVGTAARVRPRFFLLLGWMLWVFLNSPSGVVGQTKQFNGAHLAVAFVLPFFVVAGVGQQRPLGVPGDGEGGRVTLDLPQLLSWARKDTHTHQSCSP